MAAKRNGTTPQRLRLEATMQAAAGAGLTEGPKERRMSWRANGRLLRAAEEKSGLQGSDLIEYALARVALEDGYAEALLALRGSVSRDIDLEF